MKRICTLLAVLPGLLFVGYAFLPLATQAANVNVGGHISSSTSWLFTNTYIVTSTVIVDSGKTLTIQPGTTVKFATATTSLTVTSSGILVAEGTVASSITFTASSNSPTAGFWDSILLKSGASSTISNASVKYGRRGYDCSLQYHIW